MRNKLPLLFYLVRGDGLEPTRLTARDFKSPVSTNFTNPANSFISSGYEIQKQLIVLFAQNHVQIYQPNGVKLMRDSISYFLFYYVLYP